RGSGTGPDRVVHRTASGVKKASYTPTIFGSFPSPSEWIVDCRTQVLAAGDTLTFLDLADPGQPIVIQTYTVPTMTAVANRVRDRVTGVVSGVKQVSVTLQTCLYVVVPCDLVNSGTLGTGANGAYLYAPAVPMNGASRVSLMRS